MLGDTVYKVGDVSRCGKTRARPLAPFEGALGARPENDAARVEINPASLGSNHLRRLFFII